MIVATRLLQDTVRVLQEYRMPLRSHALHAYHSAYVTMPQCLLLDTLQQQSLPRSLPSMTSPRELHWGPWNRAIEGHESEVLCVAVSPDGRRIASGSRDGTVRVWGTTTLEEIARLTPEDKCYISCIAFSPDGARFATCSMAGFIYIWNFDTLEQLAILELNRDTSVPVWQNIRDHVTCYALFSNNGNLTVAAAGGDLCIWSANTFEELGNFKGYAPLALSLDDSRIVACRSRTMIDAALYDAIAFEELVRLEPFAGRILATAFSPDGLHIVFYLNDNSLKVWNAATSEVIESFEGPKYGFVNAVTFSPCGTRMVSAHSDRMLRLWDAAGYKELATFKGHEGSISAVAFSPEGTQLVSGSEDKTVRIWSAIDLEGSIKLENDRLRQTWARSIAFLPCGARIISRVGDEPVRIWDAETSKELGELQNVPNDSRATIIVWSPDGSLITANYGGRHSLLVWNTRTFEMVAELERGFDANTSFSCAAFSRDSKCIVSGMRNGVILVWSTLNSEVVVELKSLDSRATCVAYSPDGSYIAAGGELTLRVWNAVTYEELYLHHSSKHASSLEFSHDGARLMVLFRVDTEGNRGNTCVIWSMDTFHAIAEFESEDYRPATFTADGKGVLFFDLDSDGNAITSAWMPSQVDSST
jgi:WD40 repeat protein